jgi:hypothetical protein
MRQIGLGLVLVCAVSAADVSACGDKYVVFGQGVRFQRAYAAVRPARILVYQEPGPKSAAPRNRERLLTVLRMVGHRPDAVATVDEMRVAVGANRYDVVLTEFTTTAEATAIAAAAPVPPTVIPMIFDPTTAERTRIERENSCAVQVSKRSHELLTVINTVMDQRSRNVTQVCQRKRAM